MSAAQLRASAATRRQDRSGRRLRAFGGLQGKMVLLFLLITLLTMQVVGVFLATALESYYVGGFERQMQAGAAGLALVVAPDLAAPLADTGTIGQLAAAFGDPTQFAVVVVDRAGVVRAVHPGSGTQPALGQIDPDPAVMQALTSGLAQTTQPRTSATGRPYVTYVTPVVYQGREVGAVEVRGYLDQIYRTLAGVRRVLFEATLVALALSGLLSLLLARTITGPIQELTRRAGDLARGNFDRLLEVRSGDELGRLAAMFNAMTVRLRDTLGAISAEQRKAEAILTNMADGIVAVGADGDVTLTNPAAERLLNVAVGAPVPDVIAPLFNGGPSPARLALPERGLVLLAHVASLQEGSMAVLQDVSEQERLEALRREFVADVSHELRTPITTIKSYVDSLLDGGLAEPETARSFLGVVADETNRMVRLVNDLLRLSQFDSRRAAAGVRRPTDMAALVQQVAGRLNERCHRKDIALRCHAPDELLLAYADADRITQVLANLLANAIDFTAPGGTVDVAVDRCADGIAVRVRDTGVGIPPEDLPRIFDRFYRVDKARSREFGGTGLGLSIAKRIIEAHEGTISVSSRLGEGTEVRFTLPVAPDDAP